MRRLILTVLLATGVALPAMAQDRDDRQRDRGERAASREGRDEARAERRAQRAERAERADFPAPERAALPPAERAQWSARGEERQQAVSQQSVDQQAVRRGGVEQRGERRHWGERRSNNDGMAAAIERQEEVAQAREAGQLVEQQQRDYRRDGRIRPGSTIDRAIDQNARRDGQFVQRRDRDDGARSRHAGSDRRWSNQWRSDRNYNWRNYRHRNRSVFRLGNYWDPYGSRYRRFSIGFSLFPNYYQSNYWLDDPWQYRLPPAYGPYRWVRYYDDALLVNIYTGQVVDVEHNFFW